MQFKRIALGAIALTLAVATPLVRATTLDFNGNICAAPPASGACTSGFGFTFDLNLSQAYGDNNPAGLNVIWDANIAAGGLQDFAVLAAPLYLGGGNRVGIGAPGQTAEVFIGGPGLSVTLNSFDLGSLFGSNRDWEVLDGNNNVLASGNAANGLNSLTTIAGPGWTSASGIKIRYDVEGVSLPANIAAILANPQSLGQFTAIDNINYSVAPIPEPSTYALLLAGLGMMGLMMRRRTRNV